MWRMLFAAIGINVVMFLISYVLPWKLVTFVVVAGIIWTVSSVLRRPAV